MKRPVVWILLFLISGICMGRYLSIEEYRIFLSAFFFGITFLLCWKWKRISPILFFVFFVIGVVSVENSWKPVNVTLDAAVREGKELHLIGQVTEKSQTRTGREKLTVVCRDIQWEDGRCTDKIQVSMLLPENEKQELWDVIAVSGTLELLEERSVPGGFYEKMYMKTRGFSYKMYPEEREVVWKEPPFVRSKIQALRDKINGVYDSVLPEDKSGIIKAMLTGYKEDLDETTRELLEKAGISHLLAISGIHISMIAMLLHTFFVHLCRFRRRVAGGFILLFLLGYLLLVGFAPSIVRAVIMTGIGLFGHIIFRSDDKINNLALAGSTILLIEPLFLWDVGFQCSFVMTSCIVAILNMMEKDKMKEHPAINAIGFSLAVTICSYGITAYYFHKIAISALLVNLIVLPMSGFLIGMSILVALIGLVSIKIAAFLGGTIVAILNFYQWVCQIAISLFGEGVCFTPSIFTVFLFYGALAGIYFWNKEVWLSKIYFVSVLGLFSFSLVANPLTFQKDTLAFLDVGQGDSTVYTTYDGKAFVFDTGGMWNAEKGANTGERIVRPYLEYQSISKIEGLFLSHMDADHCAGALELMENMPVERLYLSAYDFEPSVLYASVLETANRKNIPITRVKRGDKAEITPGVVVECLYPPMGIKMMEESDNHGSMVLRLSYGDTSVLLMGDAGILDEAWMMKEKPMEKVDILKAGHHGSKTSTSEVFLKAVMPDVVIFSCGKNNRYGHPDDEVLQRSREVAKEIIRTDENGTIWIELNKEGYDIHRMSQEE